MNPVGIKHLFSEDWYELLLPMLSSKYFDELSSALARESNYKTIYPDTKNIFRVFRECSYEDICIVILGQDVYPSGAATGLAFSNDFPDTPKISPSLKNILKEVDRDIYNGEQFKDKKFFGFNPDLSRWSKQGIFLYNMALTVEKDKPESHLKAWREFTEYVITCLNKKKFLIWMLLGNKAQEIIPLINKEHRICKAGHPSFLNTTNPFYNCGIFSQVEGIMIANNLKEIKW